MPSESDQSPERAVRVNCVGMDNVLRAAVAGGVDRVVYASSIATYGSPEDYSGTIREDARPPAAYTAYPLLFYSATKQLNEYQARLYADRSEGETGSSQSVRASSSVPTP
ncbi:MAG: NAD(P)-dependent oxidoreductase [Haloarculaceae archaeon]